MSYGKSRRVKRRKTPRRPRRGSTTLEFAILLPLLMTLALLCVDYGRFCHSYIAVTNAARAGAGFGSAHPVPLTVKPLWDAAVRQAVERELSENPWFDPAQLTMPTPQSVAVAGGARRVTVDVRYPFQTVVNWPFLPGYNDPIVLRRVVVMPGIR